MSDNVSYRSLTPPYIHLVVESVPDQKVIPSFLLDGNNLNSYVRAVRGRKMQTLPELMNEFSAVFQFPVEPFGENWHALNDCMASLDEWMPAAGYVVYVKDAHYALSRHQPDQFFWFLVTMQELAEYWSRPIKEDGCLHREPVAFHTLLHCPNADQAAFDGYLNSLLGRYADEYHVPVQVAGLDERVVRVE